ncbi:HD domain-containing protein [Maribacter sp. 2307ULW6-5]|uniref:HD domain-containing protein n=1 Tax=Maribacter sp. 2307ULW6-5 TaxID=3386275 RepID=UPI0039BD843C
MKDAQLVEETIAFVKETLSDAEGGHDWFHIQRVFKNSMLLAQTEKVDLLVVSLGALLHDIADAKFHNGDESIGPKMAKAFLESMDVPKKTVEHVVHIIEHISFKNSLEKGKKEKFSSLELQVVQDADRLDAIGAIGIARAFNYGGFKNRAMHDPNIMPNPNMGKAEYKKSKGPTINHFYEKLLLLKDQMNTATGKQLAEQRHQYMLDFLEQFYAEWNPLGIKGNEG